MHDLPSLAAALVPLLFMVYWITDAFKDLTNADWKSLATKAAAYGGSWVVISLYAHSGIDLGGSGKFFADLPAAGIAFLALVPAAGGGSFMDYLRARNPADGTVKSSLNIPGQ